MNDLGDMRMVDENCDVMNSAAQQLSLASLNLLEEAVTARDQAKTANQRLQQEIAEHKASEEALRVSEEQHRLLLQFLPVGVVVHASDTSILISNQEAERLLGLSMEMMQGKTALDPAWRFVREDGSPMPVEEYPVSRVLATGKPVENLLLGVDRYMGAERVWILVNAFPQLDEAGQVRHVEVTFMDLTERKRVEVALNNERLQLRTLIDNLPYSIYVKDTECRFVVANQTLVRRMGVAGFDALVGQDDAMFHPAELARQYRDDEMRIMREGIGIYGKEERTRIATGGGALRWSSTTKVPLKNVSGDVVGLVGIGIDITERKRTESYREMRRDIIQLLNEPGDQQDIMQRVIALLKNQTGFDAIGLRLRDGEDFPYYSQDGFPQEFLLTERTLLRRDADGEICRDKDGNACLECTCGLVISGKTDPASPLFTKGGSFWTNNSFDLLELAPDQDPRDHPRNTCIHDGYASVALIPVRDKDRIIGLIHLNDRRKDCFTVENVELLENIASYIGGALMRRKAEAALEKQNGLVNSLLQNLQIGVYMVEVPSGKPLLANEASFKMLGRGLLPESHASTITKVYDLYKSDSNEPYPNDELPLVVAMKGVSKYVDDMIVVHPDGTRVALEVFGSPIKDQHGNIWASLVSFQDITERKAAEKALHDIAESKAKFASTVAHELRSPLAMIKESTNIIMDEIMGPLNIEQKEMLRVSKNNIERLGRLINNVLALQKIGAKKMDYDIQVHDVNDVVKEAHINAVLYAGDRKADVMMELGSDLPRIKFDTDKIMQVLINLLANAIKYSESGPVVVQTRLENSEIQISVRDSGQGIYPEELDEIFKPFVQAKGKKKGGTGLGLAITKEIVLAHHGRIWVESEVGKGSIFHFTLPIT